MGLSAQQQSEAKLKYAAYKAFYFHDLPVTYDANSLTEEGAAKVDRRIDLLRQVARTNNSTGQYIDAAVITQLVCELQTRLELGKDLAWEKLSQSEKNYQNMIHNHPEWRVQSNIILDMTGPIVDESMSLDVAAFQTLIIGWLIHSVMPKLGVTSPPGKPTPLISKIAAFTGDRKQFRAYVLKKLMSEPRNPLRFLLNAAGNGWNTASRAHDVLIDRYDIWEAGHIMSDKIGGVRLMIQTAWENQIQGQSIEVPSKGGAVLDNPAVEIGGLPVAKSTAKTWELAGKLPAGSADTAPIIVESAPSIKK